MKRTKNGVVAYRSFETCPFRDRAGRTRARTSAKTSGRPRGPTSADQDLMETTSTNQR